MATRRGGYRRLLSTPEQLKTEGPEILLKIQPYLEKWQLKQITDAEMAATYILIYLQHRHPQQWITSSTKSRWDLSKDAISLFKTYSMKATPRAVNQALVAWSEGKYPLRLLTYAPSALELLEMQARGERCVTMMTDKTSLCSLILEQRDPLGFILHDLIHAEHFYSDRTKFLGQIGFQNLILRSWQDGMFNVLLDDPLFKKEFYYVVSDMNSYCVHLLKCLKAVCLAAYLRHERKKAHERLSSPGFKEFTCFIRALCADWQMPGHLVPLVLALNSETPLSETQIISIQKFLDNVGTQSLGQEHFSRPLLNIDHPAITV